MNDLTPEMIKAVQEIATKAAEAVYAQKGTQYGVATVPAHSHNGIDSNIIPGASLEGFIPLQGTNGGVISPDVLLSQYVNNAYGTGGPPDSIYAPRLNIIYGNEGGGQPTFNGGNALEGTMVFFNNTTGPRNQIWVFAAGAWHGVNLPL